ncbi:MAG: hypothetical protein NTX95_03365 [Actinobacteria bacterium]|nr:hypothetical protein [Actinomycetota bacterium]
MNTSLPRLVTSLFLIVGSLTLTSPARAGDAVISYQLPTPDLSGITAQVAPGVAGCVAGCGTLKLVAGAAVPARRQGMLAFSAPAGTTILSAAIRLRYRTKQQTVSARLQSQIGGRWVDGQRLRSAAGSTATVTTGKGASAVAVTLATDGAVPARSVRSENENMVAVNSVQLTVRDASPPSVAWTAGDPATGTWQRGALCGAFSARDTGLGVAHVEYFVGGLQASAQAGPGTRLQPSPTAFDGSICVDTTQLADGTYGTALTAVDGGSGGNRSAAVSGLARVDNTPPLITYQTPTDLEARLPVAQLMATDAASGVERVAVTIDDFPAAISKLGGAMRITPAAPLADGVHRIAWEAIDVAGNQTLGSELFGVADVTAPVIEDVQPQGTTSPTAAVTARAVDVGAGLSAEGWRLAVDGVDVTGAADVSTAGTITYVTARAWSEGEHIARVTAVDKSGNRAVRTWLFSIPVTPAAAPTPVAGREPLVVVSDAAAAPEPVVATTASRPQLRLHPSTRRVRAGAALKLKGRLTGSDATRVRIEARVGRAWRLVVRVPISPIGTFSTLVRLPAAGSYDVRAHAGETVSRSVRLQAR